MYWLVGTDTIGPPQHEWSVESHVWSGTGSAPQVIIHQLLLNVNRRTNVDTFSLAPNGRVTAVNHRPPTGDERVDLFLQLPHVALLPGTRWSDSLRASGTDPGGAEWYDVDRDYRVVRLIDTLGYHGIADIAADGQIRMRFGFWVDSAAGTAAWIDVIGPVKEHYLFDPARGRLLRRTWSMDLRGKGVAPTGRRDTVPAGLSSDETVARDDSPRAAFLLAPLPGTDTSMSVTAAGSAILLHTTGREDDRITASMTRNDGMVGVARAVFRDHAVSAFSGTWAGDGTMQRIEVAVRSDSLVVHRTAVAETTLPIPPAAAFGIADYGMEELLSPVLLSLPRDGAPRPVAVFRPYPGHWDIDTVAAQARGDGVVFSLGAAGTAGPQTLFFTPDGDYLYRQDADNTRRVPIDSVRQAKLRAAIARMGGG